MALPKARSWSALAIPGRMGHLRGSEPPKSGAESQAVSRSAAAAAAAALLSHTHTPPLTFASIRRSSSHLLQVKSTRGKVISAGKGTTLSTGASVTYSQYAGTEVTLGDGKELVILKEDDVIGVLAGGPEEWGKLQPLGDRVLLQALEAVKETAGGVILASDELERPTLGKVRSVGGWRRERESSGAPPTKHQQQQQKKEE